ncbi:hypothetical protein DV735_g2878, partial [Chaetothyriales sp. CBS 134920]
MAGSTAPLLTALLKKATLDDDDEILKASNAALKKSKSDIVAQHAKIVALLKLERYADAARFVQDSGDDLKATAPLECAYALYKTGRFDDAADLAATSTSRGARHLQAQARYRLEDAGTAADLYRDLRTKPVAEEEVDLNVNQGAVDALSQWLGIVDPEQARRPGREDLEAFETAYNAACGSIARGELKQADLLLKRAEALCKYSDSLTDQEKREELLPIAAQELYVLQSLARTSDAEAIANELTLDGITDLSTRTIAHTNKIVLSSPSANPFLVHKALHSAPDIPPSDKLFSYQSILLHHNQKAADLQSLKFDGLVRSAAGETHKVGAASPETNLGSVFAAAALARNEVNKAAIKRVLPELEKRPADVGLLLTLVQMYVLTGNTASATDLVDRFLSRLDDASSDSDRALRSNPGLVSLAIALYHSQGRKADVKRELAKAASYWRQKPKAPSSLLRAAGSALLQSGTDEETRAAEEIFTKLLEQQQSPDKATIAGLIASQAAQGKRGNLQELAKLTSVDELVGEMDVDALESDGIPRSSNAIAAAQRAGSRKRKAAVDGATAKAKRVRKSRLPKNYDGSTKPDPERWLPMKDRSYYKPPKGKKKQKKAMREGGTQGGAVNEELDINAKPVASDGGGGGGKKKKGKGKK